MADDQNNTSSGDEPASGAPANYASNPRLTGDWEGYSARRAQALASLGVQEARDLAIVHEGDTDPSTRLTETQYEDARERQLITRTNIDTTMPDFLSSSGQFEPGDLEGFARRRSAESSDLFAKANGREPLTDDQQRQAFDGAMAAKTPAQRFAFWQDAANVYRPARSGEVGEADIRARLPGRFGDFIGTVVGAGGLNPGTAGLGRRRTSLRPPARAPARTSCPTCARAGAPGAELPATPNDPGPSTAPRTPANPNRPTPSSNRVDPALRDRVDAMQRGGVVPLPQRGGKDGLIDHLSTKPDEHGVYRTPDGQMYVTRGTTNEAPPRTNGDKLIFHNHPSGTTRLSGEIIPGTTGYTGGDIGYLHAWAPEQRSTVLGTPGGVSRVPVPRRVDTPRTNWDEIDALLGPGPGAPSK